MQKPRQSIQVACLRQNRVRVLSPICSAPQANQRLDNTQASPHRQRAGGRERQLVPLCSPDNFQSPGQLPEEQASDGRNPEDRGMKQEWLLPRQPQHLAEAPAPGDRTWVCLIESGEAEAWRGPTTTPPLTVTLASHLSFLVSHSPPQ